MNRPYDEKSVKRLKVALRNLTLQKTSIDGVASTVLSISPNLRTEVDNYCDVVQAWTWVLIDKTGIPENVLARVRAEVEQELSVQGNKDDLDKAKLGAALDAALDRVAERNRMILKQQQEAEMLREKIALLDSEREKRHSVVRLEAETQCSQTDGVQGPSAPTRFLIDDLSREKEALADELIQCKQMLASEKMKSASLEASLRSQHFELEQARHNEADQCDDLPTNRTDGASDSSSSLQPNDEMTPLAMAKQNMSEPCPFAAKTFNEAVQFAKEVVEKQFEGGSRKRYRNFQSSFVAMLACAIAHQTLKALTMTKREREAVEEMIEKITNALVSSDCQMHAFKDANELAAVAKGCVKADNTLKEKIGNIKTSLDHVWHDAETKDKAQKKSATRNLHRYQSEVYIELGLTKKE